MKKPTCNFILFVDQQKSSACSVHMYMYMSRFKRIAMWSLHKLWFREEQGCILCEHWQPMNWQPQAMNGAGIYASAETPHHQHRARYSLAHRSRLRIRMTQCPWSSTSAKAEGAVLTDIHWPIPHQVRKKKTSCCVLFLVKHSDCAHQLGKAIWVDSYLSLLRKKML